MAEGFPDFKKLRSTLLTSGVQQTNNALWQTIDQLLTNLGRLEALIDAASGSSSGGGSAGTITGAESSPIWREQEFDYNPLGVPGPIGPQGIQGPPGMPGDLDGGIEEAAYSSAASPAGDNPIGGFTPGSIIFAGASGTLSQDNTHLFFNRTNFRVGIGLVSPSNLLDVFGAGTDIGYVARFTENNTAGSTYIQIRSPSGNSNAQAGFTCFQQQNGIEWRFAVIGNEANAFRISGGAAATNFMYISVNGNVIINDSNVDPATGTKSLIFGDGTAPATLDANTAGLYADDVAGTVNMFAINEAGQISRLTGFTNGSVVFASANGFSEDNSHFFWEDTNNILRITHGAGVLDSPATNEFPNIHIGGDFDGVASGIGTFYLDGYGAQGNITMRRANGTQAAKTALADTNIVFNFRSYGWDGSAYGLGGLLRMIANGAYSGANYGQDLLVMLTANGSVASPAERLRVTATDVRLPAASLLSWGTAATTVALKRNSTELQVRLADDSAFADLECNNFSINANTGNVRGNVYTPVRSAEVNLDANVTLTEAQYAQVGNTVTVSGRFTANPTLTGAVTSFEITLPVASNIGAVEDVAGVAFCGTIAGQGAEVIGSVANNTAVIQWISGDITNQSWSYVFTYQVI